MAGTEVLSPEEEQEKWLEDATTVVKQQAFFMKRALDNGNLRDALKHSSNMICELRTSLLTPKNYYELYMQTFDELRYLEMYFTEEMKKGRRMMEFYELVQHAGNILPRNYLLVTVGSVYIKSAQAPAKDILKDMVEMTRGVQHPTRGLFLRNYLLQMTKDKLPDVGSEYEGQGGNVRDALDFILLNFTEMNKLWVRMQHQGPVRDREKREKERLDLRILVGTNLVRLSQLEGVDLELYKEFVLPRILEQAISCKDQIAQAYLMDCVIQVFPDEYHLQTLEIFLSTCTQLQQGVDLKTILINLMNRLANFATAQPEQIPEDVKIFNIFTVYVAKVIQHQSNMELTDILSLQVALLNFALRCYPDRLDYVDHVLGFCTQMLGKLGTRKLEKVSTKYIVQLLTLPVDAYKNILTVLELQNYPELMTFLDAAMRKKVAIDILKSVAQFSTTISEPDKVEKLFNFIKPLTEAEEEDEEEEQVLDEDFQEEQYLVARLVRFLDNEDSDTLFKLYAIARKNYAKGGEKRIKYTLVPLVFCSLELCGVVKARENEGEELQFGCKKIFQFVHEICRALSSILPDIAMRLFLQAAKVADECEYESIAYEFVTQAFVVYEDEISGSRAQYGAVNIISGALPAMQNLSEENFDTLITKTTQHSAKLLKKPDQCRAVANASHLFWVGDTRDGRRVLECLQRALKIANSSMDAAANVSLFAEVLDHFLYYMEEGNEEVKPQHITELMDLINEKLAELGDDEQVARVRRHYGNTLRHIKSKQAEGDAGSLADIDITQAIKVGL